MLGLVNRIHASEVEAGDTLIVDGFFKGVDEVGEAQGHVMIVFFGNSKEFVCKSEDEVNRLEGIRY